MSVPEASAALTSAIGALAGHVSTYAGQIQPGDINDRGNPPAFARITSLSESARALAEAVELINRHSVDTGGPFDLS